MISQNFMLYILLIILCAVRVIRKILFFLDMNAFSFLDYLGRGFFFLGNFPTSLLNNFILKFLLFLFFLLIIITRLKLFYFVIIFKLTTFTRWYFVKSVTLFADIINIIKHPLNPLVGFYYPIKIKINKYIYSFLSS